MQLENDLLTIKYPAATVLLDLTANESCIERVAELIKDLNMLGMVIEELEISLHRRNTIANNANKVYLSRFRDLMIGIILNLTCNVENTDVIDYMVKQNVIRMLRKILVD